MPNPVGTVYIPRKISLPGPFVVTVNQIRPMKMKEKHGEYHDAVWDIDTMTVDINKKLDQKRKWYVFAHEYAHVLNDWIHWLQNKEIAVA